MSQCRNEGLRSIPKYLLIFSLGLCMLSFSNSAFSQDKDRPEPPPHPKHKSLKEMLDKINIFKKKKKENPENNATTEVEDKKHTDPPPPPDPVRPKATAKSTHKSGKSKKATRPAAKKVTQPII